MTERSQERRHPVIPAKAGIQGREGLDPGFRRGDGRGTGVTEWKPGDEVESRVTEGEVGAMQSRHSGESRNPEPAGA